jgi:hypothetical protein
MICGLPRAFSRELRPATIVYSGGPKDQISIHKVNFSQIVAHKETIRKNIVGRRYPPYAYLTHFSRVNVPLKYFSLDFRLLLIKNGGRAAA